MPAPSLLLSLLFVLCFGLAARLVPWHQSWEGVRAQSGSLLAVLLGDSRRLFANHFFVKADAYFHSGFYPGIFDDRQAHQTPHVAEDAGAMEGHNQGEGESFLGPPRDWIDRFSRHFYPSQHTHLDEGGAQKNAADKSRPSPSPEREILPWLRLSAELDPQRVETYTVSAYWLRSRLGKVDEAEQFLREGLRANPDSFEILFELGRVLYENRKDAAHARNVWELALRKWDEQEAGKADPNIFARQQIVGFLARLEEGDGRFEQALAYLEMLKKTSPNPAAVQKQIDELKARSASPSPPAKP